MAELINTFGKLRGKLGNVINYVGANGKNYCKGVSAKRVSSKEPQKRRAVAFGTVSEHGRVMLRAIRLGFPGDNGYPKGFQGFTSVNAVNAVDVEKIDPSKPVNSRKKAPSEFRGIVDYGKLLVAAGQLVPPVVDVEMDTGNRKVVFHHAEVPLESFDCFRDDVIYGVVYYDLKHVCRIEELGRRGETFKKSIDFVEDGKAGKHAVYVFARSADGKDTSLSVCLQEPME